MVKIAVAGGTGQVAQEIIDALVATKKHDITILSRNAPTTNSESGVKYRTVNYDDKAELAEALCGIHTVLSFTQLVSSSGNNSQKNLIDASIMAKVKRFAPSEWGSADIKDIPFWAGKEEIREYLREVNEDGQVLEYCLFQPGLFLNYLAFPYKTAKHVVPLNTMFDFENRRAIIVEGHDFFMTFTTVQDLAGIVAEAVDYNGQWPIAGGIRGNRVSVSQILKIGEKVRGGPCAIETVKLEDLEAGNLKTSWALATSHPSVPEDQAADLLKSVLIGTLLSGSKGAWDVSDEFNQILPDYRFTQIEEFLAKAWEVTKLPAASDEAPRGVKSVFLAGTTSKIDTSDWRETLSTSLSTSLSDVPVTIYNPYRTDWDSSWCEDIDFAPYREQVGWELDKQVKADIVVVYFHPATQAPISLLEFGICARVPGKAIVVCPEGYWKRGNVQIVCKKFGIEMVDNVAGLREAVLKRLPVDPRGKTQRHQKADDRGQSGYSLDAGIWHE
ncbi:hypothetical protein V493_05564 [Pseudogymnoascus sp. VKM F-4281 (FW-2241)]|nr:hypothetical protein V493_05564 [Pseudogymnoascus sp. VKM F-4281 (FW-2241)]